MNSGRGWHTQFFCWGPRTGALAENVSRPQAFKEVNNIQVIYSRKKKKYPFFSARATSRCSKAWFYKVSRKYSKNWLRRTNIKSNLTPKIECSLKPSNYDAKPGLLHFTPQKSKCSPCLDRAWNIAHVFNVPLPSLLRFFFSFAGNVGSLKTQISKKKQPNYLAKKTKTKKNVKGSAGA